MANREAIGNERTGSLPSLQWPHQPRNPIRPTMAVPRKTRNPPLTVGPSQPLGRWGSKLAWTFGTRAPSRRLRESQRRPVSRRYAVQRILGSETCQALERALCKGAIRAMRRDDAAKSPLPMTDAGHAESPSDWPCRIDAKGASTGTSPRSVVDDHGVSRFRQRLQPVEELRLGDGARPIDVHIHLQAVNSRLVRPDGNRSEGDQLIDRGL